MTRRPPHAAFWLRLRRPDPILAAVLLLTVVALVTRLAGLADRAVHHDESLHQYYSWQLAQGWVYEHTPLMHGPLQFHLIAAFFQLLGDSDLVGRLPHALAGTALVSTPLLFRRWLNGPAVVLAAAFLLLSPSILYYSRFARNEPFVALFTVLMVWAVLEYRRAGGLRPLLVYSAAFALQFAAKETGYLIVAVLLLYLNSLLAHELYWGSQRGREDRPGPIAQLRAALVLTPVAWVIALLWRPLRGLRERQGWRARPRSADLLVLTIALVLPLLGAALRVPFMVMDFMVTDIAVDDEFERRLALVAVPATIALATAAGLLWRPWWWAWCTVVAAAILVPLYTTFGTNPAGAAGIVWTSLDYWLDQQQVKRGGQPWFYYLWMLSLYESLILLPGVVGGAWLALRRRDGLAAFFLFWFGGLFLGLSYAGEKMPWLTVHLALPLAFMAAYVLGSPLPGVVEAMRRGSGAAWRWAGSSALATLLVLLLMLTVRTDWGLNWSHPDTPVEPMIYVQTAPDVPRLAEEIRVLFTEGRADRVLVHTEQSMTWPWAWYLRDLPVAYAERWHLDESTIRPTDVVLVLAGSIPEDERLRAWFEPPQPFVHRWWFPESGYRATSWGDLWHGLRDGTLPPAWAEFLRSRGDPKALGRLRGEMYVPRLMTPAAPAAPIPAGSSAPSSPFAGEPSAPDAAGDG